MYRKYIYLIYIIILVTTALKAQDQSDTTKSPSTEKSPIKSINSTGQDTLFYEVFGMDCPGCHSMLEKHVNAIDDVQLSQADWVNQHVMIVVKKDSVLDEKILHESIEKANFTPGNKKKE